MNSNSSSNQLDEQYMRRALELAWQTIGLASPNPQVGCVLVRSGVIVGEGAHIYEERDHAEIVALKQAGEVARGATAYVTLEPCSHHGRTGPCANALIAAGVGRVVAATVDPNPQVSGKGIERLRAAGIEVTVGVLEQEAHALNNAFARFIRARRPLVTLKTAVSADGMIAPAKGVAGQIHWVTGPEARAEVQRMRHAADAVLTGIGTILADDPLLTDRSGILGPGGRVRRRPLLRTVLDSRLRTPLDSQLVRGADGDVLMVCGPDAEDQRIAELKARRVQVEQVDAPNGRLDLQQVMDLLGERKILSVLLECGSQLNGAFLKAGLVDQVVLFQSKKKLGDDGVTFAAGIASPQSLEQSMIEPTHDMFGDDARVSGLLRDPWRLQADTRT